MFNRVIASLIPAYKEFCGTIAVLVTGWGEITNNNLYCILLHIARPFLHKDTFNKHISLFVILSCLYQIHRFLHMFPLFERQFHNWLSVVKDSSFLYFIAENLMPSFLYKRKKKTKSIYKLVQWNVKLVIVHILEECVYMCLCVLATSSRNLTWM